MKDKIIYYPTAFPVPENWCQDGMSLRDYFAAKAMASIISAEEPDEDESYDDFYAEVAVTSYEVADAMLEARKG